MPDNVPIQGIEFEIKGNADKSAESLNKLAETLKKLKSATANTGISRISNALNKMRQDAGGSAGALTKASEAAKKATESFNNLKEATDKAIDPLKLSKSLTMSYVRVFRVYLS